MCAGAWHSRSNLPIQIMCEERDEDGAGLRASFGPYPVNQHFEVQWKDTLGRTQIFTTSSHFFDRHW